MSEGMEEAMMGLRQWMFDHVYKNEIPKAEEGRAAADAFPALFLLYGSCR